MSNSKIWASSGILYVSFFWNMLQYALIFENVLFTFTIIYITFLFSLGLLPLSPHLLFLPSVSSFLHRIVSALSLSTPRHCLLLRWNSGQSIKPRYPTWTRPTLSDRRPPTQPHELDPPHPQQPMAWSSRHATPPSMSCHPPRHRNLPPSDFSQLAYSGGFCFWVCLIWDVGLFDLVVFFFFFLIEAALVDVGLCQWWLSVLLRQWWLCRCCWGWGW